MAADPCRSVPWLPSPLAGSGGERLSAAGGSRRSLEPERSEGGLGGRGARSRRGFSPSPQPLSLMGKGARSQASFRYRSLALERQDPIGAERCPSSPLPWRERGSKSGVLPIPESRPRTPRSDRRGAIPELPFPLVVEGLDVSLSSGIGDRVSLARSNSAASFAMRWLRSAGCASVGARSRVPSRRAQGRARAASCLRPAR